jgi:hypothetical protein
MRWIDFSWEVYAHDVNSSLLARKKLNGKLLNMGIHTLLHGLMDEHLVRCIVFTTVFWVDQGFNPATFRIDQGTNLGTNLRRCLASMLLAVWRARCKIMLQKINEPSHDRDNKWNRKIINTRLLWKNRKIQTVFHMQ